MDPSHPYDPALGATGLLGTYPLPGDQLAPVRPCVTRETRHPADAPEARTPEPQPARMIRTPPMPRGGGVNRGVRSRLSGKPTK